MKTHLDLIHIDVNQLLAIGADLRDLPVKIDRVAATGAVRNNNPDDLCSLFHLNVLSKCVNYVITST